MILFERIRCTLYEESTMQEIIDQPSLIQYVNEGHKVDYIFFWGHRKPKTGVSKSCFSQWYDSSFEIDGIRYQTAEHYMMAEKARIFNDEQAVKKAIEAKDPRMAKKIGRSVRHFDEALWQTHRFEIVVRANLAKFSQNQELGSFLRSTQNRVLVEASPLDKIWGIGLAADDPKAASPHLWKGLNLLGFALMKVRTELM